MSDMKCPICGNDLEQYHTGLVCYRHCLNGKNVWGSEETLKELERTRKALDVAVDALNKIDKQLMTGIEMTCQARNALDEITALEQKDVK